MAIYWDGNGHVEYDDSSKEDKKSKFGLSKHPNAVCKKYYKRLCELDDLNEKILKILERQMKELDCMKDNDPTYNVRLNGYMDILETQFTATSNLISEMRYDIKRNNYKEGEQ